MAGQCLATLIKLAIMIDLAISIDQNARGTTVVETNQGHRMAAPNWPQDSDFRLVASTPGAKKCEVIWPEELAGDISLALKALESVPEALRTKPDWYGRLRKYAAGTT
jgi:hypothetical protein